jgi:hypothetical protein
MRRSFGIGIACYIAYCFPYLSDDCTCKRRFAIGNIDVLNVQKYPQATFDVSSALPTGQTGKRGLPTYELVGDFTLHGTKKPIHIVAEVEQARGWLHVRGNFVISQTSYGITPFSKVFGAIGVADALRIYGDLWVAPNSRISMNGIPERN